MTYEEELSDLWRRIKAEREPGARRTVSLFAGGGGSSMGYKASGFDVRLACEWDAYPANSYRHNFPETHMHHGDVAQLTIDEVLEVAQVKPGELDVLDGSPPCQGFSTAGKRQLTDPRNSLFKEYVRLLRGLKPKALVMENVSGMVKGKMRWVFVRVLEELEASGYTVSCRLMDARWFGVPQKRSRVIFIGYRNDLGIEPSHPGPERRPVLIYEALPWLNGLSYERGEVSPESKWNPYNKTFRTEAEPVNCIPKMADENFVATGSIVPGDIPAPPLRGKGGEIARRLHQGKCGKSLTLDSFFNNQRLDEKSPSVCIPKTGAFARSPTLTIGGGSEARGLSVGEVKRLSSFPDEYEFPPGKSDRDTWSKAWAVCGNSVPPNFMRAISGHVMSTLDKAGA